MTPTRPSIRGSSPQRSSTARQPAGRRQGLNRYAYARNSPMSFVDPTGESPVHAGGLGAVVAGYLTLDSIATINDIAATAYGAATGDPAAIQMAQYTAMTMGQPAPNGAATWMSAERKVPKLARFVGEFGDNALMWADEASKAPVHHLATNKNFVSTARGGPWSPRFQDMFERAGMSLDNAANKIAVPGHGGPHPQAYHEAVFERLTTATDGLAGDAYTSAFRSELSAIGVDAATAGSPLNRLLTGM